MEQIQERALLFVLNDYTSPYSNILYQARKSSLYLNRLRKLSIEIYKITMKDCPTFLSDLFTRKEIHYDLRDNMRLEQPAYNTVTYGKNSVRYQGAKLWNSLPPNIKEQTTQSQFKRLINTWLGPSCLCSVCALCYSRN